MRRFILRLASATAIGVLAAAAQAQYTAPSSPASNADLKAQADQAYAAAKSVCEGQQGTARITCLHNAKADYERWLRTGEVDASALPGAAGTGAKGGGSTKSGGLPTVQKN
jgi:hypothetical protein